MARFTFSLEALLRVREQAERAQRLVVADLERQRRALEENLRRRQGQIQEAKGQLRDRLSGTLHAEDLRMHATACLHHLRLAQRAVLELASVHQRLSQQREVLARHTARRRAVDLLRQRQWEAWMVAQKRAETAGMDDLAQSAEIRRRMVR